MPSTAGELLLWCARSFVAGSAATPAPLADMTDDEWGVFMREAVRHSFIPIVARELSELDAVPAVIRDDLATAFDANVKRNLRLAGELVTATRALAAAGIMSVSWKGPLLAERAYGDLRLRQFFDLDLLVRPSDLPEATRVLSRLGYRPELDLAPGRQAEYVAHMGELELVRDSDGLWLELHTAIVPSYFGRGRSADEMWQRLGSARLARAEVAALDPADELEALCVHGSKHLWERLEWIVDIALLARQLEPADWQRLDDGARRRGTRRMTNLGLLLATGVCGARLPADVVSRARADAAARRLAAIASQRLFEPDTSRTAELRFHVRMWDRSSDQLRYLVNVALTPSVADWQFVSLPPALDRLYPLVRPVRMLSQALADRASASKGDAKARW